MKRVTASQARREWFRILDEVIAGEVVVIERNGHRVRIEREDPDGPSEGVPDYSGLLTADRIDEADRWTWEWSAEAGVRLGDGDASRDDDARRDVARPGADEGTLPDGKGA